MEDYLKATIDEEIHKGLLLKDLIEKPLKFQELQPLADRCERIIDENVEVLRNLLSLIENGESLRFILRQYRKCRRNIQAIEHFGISALYHPPIDLKYLNNLIFKIHQEIKCPISPPFVACISTNYYYFFPFTDVIFVPIGETKLLLHLPDIFHELGHAVLYKRENTLGLKKLSDSFEVIDNKITAYYNELKVKKIRDSAPYGINHIIENVHNNWKVNWLEEFLCDLFALYTLGPAYVKAHLHLTTKSSEDVYRFEPFLPESHPSNDARMTLLLNGLDEIKLNEERAEIFDRWNKMNYVKESKPQQEYQYAYPEKLMKMIAHDFLTGMKDVGFSIFDKNQLSNSGKDKTIIKLLNDGWSLFWNDPNSYRKWESEESNKLRSS